MRPVGHEFTYPLFMMYLDLDELDEVFDDRWLWSSRRMALARFRREDHVGAAEVPLDQTVRELVTERTGQTPRGPIRLLTHLSYFGYCFNPVSFYYCFDVDDQSVETIVAEVNNTPWGEQHCYVLNEATNQGQGDHKRYSPVKKMHVSPFMQMDVDYDWRFSSPSDRLNVHMETADRDGKIFDATLKFQRTRISTASMARVLFSHPFMTVKVIVAIHWQALRLWLKRAPVYDHSSKHTEFERKQV
jgi:DUF1365 family protein